MKNKKLTYILIPLVLIIWGYLIYKIVSGLTGGDNEIIVPKNQSLLALPDTLGSEPKEIFVLKEVARDPFLNIVYTKPVMSRIKKRFQKKINWPEIRYLGLVSNESDKKSVGLIEIEGNNFFFEKGDSNQDITLIKIDKNQVVLVYKGGRKVYSKS
ncbi:hypothetical protein [Zunongwangia pacifica]|uniref:Uncharacterized protein n=1 Tax=Zunongwangia pacifica TaxID=2911062 RepID=A0A9X1ZZJ6_9FLAO|nr:hypothetical protein [Zunongwangia pacifica]MCL6220598.1 hypothetical protein [Zunongwangia pacifica]